MGCQFGLPLADEANELIGPTARQRGRDFPRREGIENRHWYPHPLGQRAIEKTHLTRAFSRLTVQ